MKLNFRISIKDYLDSDDLESETEDYYQSMDNDLSHNSKIFDGLIRQHEVKDSQTDERVEDRDAKLSVDMNLVAGMLKSYESQMGLSGPAGNLLGSLGIELPHNKSP